MLIFAALSSPNASSMRASSKLLIKYLRLASSTCFFCSNSEMAVSTFWKFVASAQT